MQSFTRATFQAMMEEFFRQERASGFYSGGAFAGDYGRMYSQTVWDSGPMRGRVDVVMQPVGIEPVMVRQLGVFGGVEVYAPKAEDVPCDPKVLRMGCVHAWFKEAA